MHAERDTVMANLSVCPMPVIVSKRMDISLNFFDGLVGRGLHVFEPHAQPLQNSKRNPLSGGVKYTGWVNFAIIACYFGNGANKPRPIVRAILWNSIHTMSIDQCWFH